MSRGFAFLLILFSSLSVFTSEALAAAKAAAVTPATPKSVTPKSDSVRSFTSENLEQRIEFSYETADGEFGLSCKHWIANPGAGDFTVICGKGTPTVKEYSVHLVVREHPRKNATTFEVLYWITDRNAKNPDREFKSHSQLLTVKGTSSLESFVMSQGLENDAAQMTLRYAP